MFLGWRCSKFMRDETRWVLRHAMAWHQYIVPLPQHQYNQGECLILRILFSYFGYLVE